MSKDDFIFSCSNCAHLDECTLLASEFDEGYCDEYEPVSDNIVHHY